MKDELKHLIELSKANNIKRIKCDNIEIEFFSNLSPDLSNASEIAKIMSEFDESKVTDEDLMMNPMAGIDKATRKG